MWFITVIAVVASMVSAFYYLQLIKLMWFKDSPSFHFKVLSDITVSYIKNLSFFSATIISVSTYFILTALINPTPWLILANQTIIGSLI
jgi:NADH:ubiquinone oxidoreductase subunit 2 (subunit N)